MELGGNTVLITGGATGIGWALAERFHQAGSQVIICGRRQDRLLDVQKKYPQIKTRVCDVSQELERAALFSWITTEFPETNVLINNAGIQRRIQLAHFEEWALTRQEIAINFEAPVHLATLFIPHLLRRKNPAILNVSSGLAFAPIAGAPIYCATKAALHSFTLSLRHQLFKTAIKVIEIIPPAVNTDLGGPGLHTFGVPLKDFTDSVITQLSDGALEITYGTSAKASRASREELNEIFNRMNERSN